MKITLFFCAGNLAETIGVHRVSEMNGVGRRMPWTMAAFTVGALGMIGVPPIAGFVSKWYLGTGSVAAGADWVIVVLGASSLLNAMYFLPILHRAWFREPDGEWARNAVAPRLETHWMLLIPPVLRHCCRCRPGCWRMRPSVHWSGPRRIAEGEYLR
jgi:formate hydrogenlyase subunit 3/multisubunit Na+/H+ antiporter MnhD subunit